MGLMLRGTLIDPYRHLSFSFRTVGRTGSYREPSPRGSLDTTPYPVTLGYYEVLTVSVPYLLLCVLYSLSIDCVCLLTSVSLLKGRRRGRGYVVHKTNSPYGISLGLKVSYSY